MKKANKSTKNNKKYESLETVRKVATRKAIGIKFINGVSNKYDANFPKSLDGLVDKEKYLFQM